MYIKLCLIFNVLNQNFEVLGDLITARMFAGMITNKDCLFVFGGMGMNYCELDKIERINLKLKGAFEDVTIKNQSLLKQRNFISFAHNNCVLIAGS